MSSASWGGLTARPVAVVVVVGWSSVVQTPGTRGRPGPLLPPARGSAGALGDRAVLAPAGLRARVHGRCAARARAPALPALPAPPLTTIPRARPLPAPRPPAR